MSSFPNLPRPLLILVSGKPGSGKSTLAQRLADQDALWLPLVSRDAIKQGLGETLGISPDDEAGVSAVTQTSVDIFYEAIGHLLSAGVGLIAEQSFRRGLDESRLQPLTLLARTVIVHCHTSPDEARRRFVERARSGRPEQRPARSVQKLIDQMEAGTFDWVVFEPPDLDVPMLRVDTSHTYAPGLDTIIAFCRGNSVG